MTKHNLNFSKVIGIAGQMGVGKTSLSNELSQKLGIPRYSFGNFVRFEAEQLGIESTRIKLQELGENLVTQLGPSLFVDKFLSTISVDKILVIDGVRHFEVWAKISSMSLQSYLVFLDIPEEARIERLVAREQRPKTKIVAEMEHPMEKAIARLRPSANIVISDALTLPQITDLVISGLHHSRFVPNA